MKRPKLEEGTVFQLQLDDGRWSVGVIARKSPKGGTVSAIYSYFFGPFDANPEVPKILPLLKWEKAVLVLKSSALHLHEGKWSIIGTLDHWDRKDWPLARFLRVDVLRKSNCCVTYDEDDISKIISETETEVLLGLLPDQLSGARAAEIHLSHAMGAVQKLH